MYIDSEYTHAEDFRQFKQLYSCDSMRAERNDLRKQVFELEKIFGQNCINGNDRNKEECKELQLDLTDVMKELEGCRIDKR